MLLLSSMLILPFIFFSSKKQPWKNQSKALTWIQDVLFTLEYSVHNTVTSLKNNFNTYINLSQVAQENLLLKKKLNKLSSALIDYQSQAQENNRLRKLLNFTADFKKKELFPAEVIAYHLQGPFQSIRTVGGKNHHLAIGMPVISAQGVVGKILRVGQLYADVQLITDGSFSLDVLIERTRVRSLLRGGDTTQCFLLLHHQVSIRIGDTIVTSSMLGLFPKELPVGKVVKISRETDDITQIVTVKPWASIEALEEVLVLKKNNYDVEQLLDMTKDSS